MVYFNDDELDSIFHALSDRTRRDILKRLAYQELGIRELADTYEMSLPGVSKHIRVLEKAHLVKTSKEGRVHRCVIQFKSLQKASDQIEFYKKFWTKQLDGIEKFVEEIAKQKRTKGRKKNG
ncbi:MAG: metalloregulator ArsR/SmtB family transcription factor [Oligoflexia bacterium]|nr:metalloregulator ArsR/SmtB family transcription factor [Oligoflexia bacterium]